MNKWKEKINVSPLLVILAGCLWGAMGLFVRKLNQYGVESMTIVWIRGAFTAVLLCFGLLIYKKSLLKIKWKDFWVFLGGGLCSIVFFNFCYFKAISMMSMSAAAVLLYTSPVFVVLLSCIFFREKLTLKKVICIVCCVLGLSFVSGLLGGNMGLNLPGILYGMGSALGYALYSIFGRVALNKGYSVWTITFWNFAFAAVCSAPFCEFSTIGTMWVENKWMIGFCVVFAVLITILPYVCYTAGQSKMENSMAAVLATIEPIAATIYGMILYHEFPSFYGWIGIVLVLGATIYGGLEKKEK